MIQRDIKTTVLEVQIVLQFKRSHTVLYRPRTVEYPNFIRPDHYLVPALIKTTETILTQKVYPLILNLAKQNLCAVPDIITWERGECASSINLFVPRTI